MTDAYVELKFDSFEESTKVCRKTLNPVWNEGNWLYKFHNYIQTIIKYNFMNVTILILNNVKIYYITDFRFEVWNILKYIYIYKKK